MKARAGAAGGSLLLLLLLAGTPAHAEDLARAKQFFELGAQSYEKGDFRGAIDAFEQAHRLAPRPAIAFSIAQAHRRQYFADKKAEHVRAAVARYREYLQKDPNGSRAAEAAEALATLEPIAEKLGAQGAEAAVVTPQRTRLSVMTSPPGGRVSVDGAPAVAAPVSVDVKPGTHRVVATLDGYVEEAKDVPVTEGDTALVDVKLTERPAQLVVSGQGQIAVDGRPVGNAPTPRPIEVPAGTHLVTVTSTGHDAFVRELDLSRGEVRKLDPVLPTSTQRKVAVGVLVGSAVAAVTGGVFIGVALAEESRATAIRDRLGDGTVSPADVATYESAKSARDTWTTASFVAWGVSAAALATGALLWVFDSPRIDAPTRESPKKGPTPEEKKPSFELGAAPLLAPTLVGATLSGRF